MPIGPKPLRIKGISGIAQKKTPAAVPEFSFCPPEALFLLELYSEIPESLHADGFEDEWEIRDLLMEKIIECLIIPGLLQPPRFFHIGFV